MRIFTLLLTPIGLASAAVEAPVTFEPEGNQFTARAGSLTARISGDGARLELGSEADRVSLRLKGARDAEGQGEQPMSSVANYYPGADPAKWRVGVPQFERVRFKGVYPGIDAVYYGNEHSLEYDFLVSPGADPSVIRIGFDARSVRLTPDGEISIASARRDIRQRKPVAYQMVNGRRIEISAHYRLRGDEARIELGLYDKTLPLVIDPQLVFSLSLANSARKVVIDATGAIHVLSGFGGEAKVSKFSPAGALLYTTVIGDPVTARLVDISADGNGSAHVSGSTSNASFPLVNAFRSQFVGPAESFLVRLSATGAITFSSFVAAVAPIEGDIPPAFNAVTAAADGTSYVVGNQVSGAFAKVNAQTNTADSSVYVVKVAPNGARLYATLLPAFQNTNWLVSSPKIAIVAGGVSVAGSLNCPEVFIAGNNLTPQCGGPFVRGTFVTGLGEQAGVAQIRFTKIYGDSNDTSSSVTSNAYPIALAGSGSDTYVLRGYGVYSGTITWQWVLTRLNSAGAETGARNLSPLDIREPYFYGLGRGAQFLAVSAAGEPLLSGIDIVSGGTTAFVFRYSAGLANLNNVFYSPVPTMGDVYTDQAGAIYFAATRKVDKIVPTGSQGLLGKVTMTAPLNGQAVFLPIQVAWNQLTGAQGYQVEVLQGGQTLGSPAVLATKNVPGGNVTATEVPISNGPGTYNVRVRGCGPTFEYVDCGPFSDFASVSAIAPSPLITNPVHGSVVTQSTTPLRWQAISGAGSYQLRLFREGVLFAADTFPPSVLEAPYSLPSGNYRMELNNAAIGFRVQLGAIPSAKPVITSGNVSGTALTTAFSTVTGADLYFVQVVQSGTGPGGGALSVAAKMVSATPAVLTVPQGAASILVSACNADGCGPLSDAFPINVTAPSPSAPVVGTPAAATVVNGPTVFFSWNRIPGDNGSNTTYRLYVQNMAAARPALDVYTNNNYWAANLRSGLRYDVLVIANPGANQTQGPANGFVVKGGEVLSPMPTQPGYQQVVRLGAASSDLNFEWSALELKQFGYYEYLVSSDGASPQTLTGTSEGTVVSLPVSAGRNYSGVVRMCNPSFYFGTGAPGPYTCGPWSSQGGTGAFRFSTVQ